MEYQFLGTFFLTLVVILLHIIYLAMLIVIINFHIDSPIYNMDRIGLTRLSKNFYFSICNIIGCETSLLYTLGFNIIVLSILFFQNLIFINKDIRQIFNKRMLYDTIYYPKLLGRFISCFSLLMLEILYQPMTSEIFFVIDFKDYIRPIWFIIPVVYGLYMMAMSFSFHYIDNNELGGCILMNVIQRTNIPRPAEYLYGRGKIFKSVRSPFRGGVMIVLFFINTRWDYGRAAYYALFCFTMLAECINEEKYYFYKYDSYRKYIETVPDRFFNISGDLDLFTKKPKETSSTVEEVKTNEPKETKDIREEDNKSNKKKIS